MLPLLGYLSAALCCASCSLLFEQTPAEGNAVDASTEESFDANGADGATGTPLLGCGAMGELRIEFLSDEDLSTNWELPSDIESYEYSAEGDMLFHIDTLATNVSSGLIGQRSFEPPYALDLAVSEIPESGNSQFILKFEHHDTVSDYIQNIVTEIEVKVYSSYTNEELVKVSRLAMAGVYFIRMAQFNNTLVVQDSADGQEWREILAHPFADTAAKPRMAARHPLAHSSPPPPAPMILHSIGSSCE